MRQGRWREPEAAEPEPQRTDKTVSVRLTEAELAEFDAQIATLGITRNRALRIAARRIGGFVEVDQTTVDALRDIARQIGGVARNVNQIAKAANRTRDPDYRGFMEERVRLGRELARVEGLMQRVLELGARRADGLARLEAAAGQGGATGRAPRRPKGEAAKDGAT
jgi:type IV secretion system T-DNA border endonuclease VirD1